MIKYFWTKIISSIPVCFLTINQSQKNIIFGVIYIVIIDTILGIMVGLKYKKISSSKLARAIKKFSNYSLALFSIWILSAVEGDLFGWAFNYLGIFIIITEILSNFEKLSLLGMKTPTMLLSRLNDDFKKYNNDRTKETALEIIEKR